MHILLSQFASRSARLEQAFFLTLSCIALLIGGCVDVGDAPEAYTSGAIAVVPSQGETWPIDSAQSQIKWKAAKVTRAHDGGFKSFRGSISVLEGDVTGVQLTIDTRSIWSDTERLTSHLKNEDFFEVEAYPEAVFESSAVVPVDSLGATHLVTGNLTMRGNANSITFPAVITVGDEMVHAVADFIINRTHWGVNYSGRADDLIEESVRLILDVRAASIEIAAVE